MAAPKSPLDHAVDLFVYAPIGLAAAARDLVPTLVERGRRQLDPQVGMARTIGQLAAAQGRSQAEKVLEAAIDRARAQAEATLRQLGVLPEPAPTAPAPTGEDLWVPTAAPSPAPEAAPAPGPFPAGGHQPSALELPIPDYDSLSASQVVPRLSSLTVSELAAVRTYEEAHRGRRTILHKIAQLQGA